MKQRYTVIFILLICLLLAACDISGEPVNTSEPTSKPEPTATQSTTAETPDPKRPSLLKNPNVTMPGEFPVCEETETLSLAIAQSPFVTSYEYGENYITTYLQDLTNVKLNIQLYPATDASQKMELLITSGAELPDIIDEMGVQTDAVRYRYGQAGAIIPLNEYYDQLGYHFSNAIDQYSDQFEAMTKDEMFSYVASPDRNVYGQIHYGFTLPNGYANRAWINEVWLKALDLKVPETSEELVEVLRAFKEGDPNGNGQPDEIPMVGANGGWNTNPIMYLMNQFIYCSTSGTTYYSRLVDGQIDATFDSEEWREGLRFTKSLVDEGLLSTLSFTQDSTQYNALVSAETQVVGVGVSGSIGSFANNKIDYTPLGAIEGPNGVRWATYSPQLPAIRLAISKDCKSPDLAFRWMDTGYVEEFGMMARYGEKGVDWDYADTGETMYASLGYKPFFKVMNNIWNVEQQKHWAGHPLGYFQLSVHNQGEVWNGDTSNNEYKNSLAVAKLIDYTPPKEDLIFKIIYLDEELEQYNEIRTNLKSYIDECMVRFVMGDMSLDNDWESYLQELEKLQYKQLIEMDQKAYERTIGK